MVAWLEIADVLFFHQQSLEEHGGLAGKPHEGALESTLARPRNLPTDSPGSSVFQLAACYGFGFAQNHCFPDGNKRLALISIDVFLQINGYELCADEADAVAVINELASGDLSEQNLALWIEENVVPFDINAE
ncbi:MAG: type II toxin-antitoxin system death-on-curing family toxin [Woeseia sp.]